MRYKTVKCLKLCMSISHKEVYQSNDVPKYRKKRHKQSTSKSSHKHAYEDCLLIYADDIPFKACYCTICGKIGKVQLIETDKTPEGYHVVLTHAEVLEKYKHLKKFHIDEYTQKYVGEE